MGGQRQYTAIFAIGAKLLGSFRGAMSAAQARMRGLQATAMRMGRGIMKFGALFGGLFASLAAFGVGSIFKKIFEGADEAAAQAHDRSRRLTAGLMTQNSIRAKGRDYALAQTKEIMDANEQLATQGVVSKALLDTSASQLAIRGLGPKQIVESTKALADMLVATKGVNASQEDMNALSSAFGKSLRGGRGLLALQQFGVTLTKPEQKILTQMAKVNDLKGAYDFLMKRIVKYAGESARALKTPEGRIHALDNAIGVMRKNIGLATEESRAEMADAWRGVLPKLQPIFIKVRKAGFQMMAGIANYISTKGMPAIEAFAKMVGKLGKAFTDQFGKMTASGKSFGDTVIEKLVTFFNWVGDNAPMIVRAIEGVTIALTALAAVAVVTGHIEIVGAAAALLAIGTVSSEWQKFHGLMEGQAVSDPDHFTQHWYLMGQSWTEVFAGMSAVVETFKNLWSGAMNWMQNAWKEFKEDIAAFKVPKWINDVTAFLGKYMKISGPAGPTAESKAQEEALKAIDEQRAAHARADWLAHGGAGTPQEQSAWIQAAKESSAGMLARPPSLLGRPGAGFQLPAIAQARREQFPVTTGYVSGGTRGMPAVAGVQTEMAQILPFWKQATSGVTEEWRTTIADVISTAGTVPSSISPIGAEINTSIIAPIDQARIAWESLATAMATPMSIPAAAIPAAAGAAVPALQHGGIVSKPTLAMMGEKGAEAVVPLSKMGGGGDTHVSFAPNITINGGASAQDQAALDSKLRALSRDFIADFKRAQSQERRLSYEGGYS